MLVGGSDRPLFDVRLPAWPVAVAAAVVLLAGLAAVVPVGRAEQRATDLGDLRVALRVDDSSRELYGSVYGTVTVEIADPHGEPLWLRAVSLDVPGLRVAPARRLPLLATDGSVALSLRFVIPACSDVALPGRVVLHAAHEERAEQVVVRPVLDDAGPSAVSGAGVLVACGLAPQS